MNLETVTPSDIGWVFGAVEHWQCTYRWSLHGLTPSPEFLNRLLWDEVALQRAAKTDTGKPVGLLQLVEVDFHNAHAYLGLLLDPGYADELGHALADFIDIAFRDFPLRKICVAAAADEFQVPPYLASSLRCIGRLIEHERRSENDYVDVVQYEIWRDKLAWHRN